MYLKYNYRGFSKERVVIKSSYGQEKITLDEAFYFVCFKVKVYLMYVQRGVQLVIIKWVT